MNKKVLIVEDQFVEANDLQIMLRKAGYEVCGIARSVHVAQEIIEKEKPGLVLLDIFLKGKLTGIDLARELNESGIAFIYLSANSNEEILAVAKTTEPYGFIVKPFREKDLLVTLEIARYRHEYSRESRYRREAEVIRQLEKTAGESIDWKEKLLQAAKIMQQEIPFDYFSLCFNDPATMEGSTTGFLRIAYDEYQMIGVKELSTISGIAMHDLVRLFAEPDKDAIPAVYNSTEFEKIISASLQKKLAWQIFEMRSMLSFPLAPAKGEPVSLSFCSRKQDAYHAEHIALLYRFQQILLKIIKQKNDTDANSKQRLPAGHEKAAQGHFQGMIGSSHLLLNAFDLITQVAPFETSVLILGESGTGKEKIAETIHNLSPRKNKPLVKVNCATLPATLIESELFGHEKGSFTGATEKRTGKFELANGGTIFLDEIGEMPVDLQVKFLRVLQEKEIERIGSRSTIKIDVRVIAATNRNLEREVGEGRFRLDLYYRLNVFPILLPPLRQRQEDIPALAEHFIHIYNRKSGKNVTGLSEKVMKNMKAYSWPGNIRELENLIERGVLLAKGSTIDDMLLPGVNTTNFSSNDSQIKTIHEHEREYIISVLKKCHGKIWGAGGAAEMLNIPPTTLKSKMKKLGIEKDADA